MRLRLPTPSDGIGITSSSPCVAGAARPRIGHAIGSLRDSGPADPDLDAVRAA